MNIPVNDNDTADLSSWFQQAINFIGKRSPLDNAVMQFIIYKVVKYKKILLIYNVYFIFSLVKI